MRHYDKRCKKGGGISLPNSTSHQLEVCHTAKGQAVEGQPVEEEPECARDQEVSQPKSACHHLPIWVTEGQLVEQAKQSSTKKP